MAPPAGTLRVGRYFLALLAILAVLYAIVFWPGQRHTPKLGLDLIGGTQVIFTAHLPGGGTPPSSSMEQAKQIMTDRVNGTGVTEATVVIQGNNQLVVSIPGANATDVQKLGAAAKLNFRGVVAPAVPVTCHPAKQKKTGGGNGSGSGSPSQPAGSQPSGAAASGVAGNAFSAHRLTAKPSATPTKHAKPSTTPTKGGKSTTPASPAPSTSGNPQHATTCSKNSVKQSAKKNGYTVPLDDTAYKKLSSADQAALRAALAGFDCASAQSEPDLKDTYFVACGDGSEVGGNPGTSYAVLLSPVIVAGDQISTASAVAPNPQQGQLAWTVSLELKGSGQSSWADYTTAHNIGGDASTAPPVAGCGTSTPCADYVAFTLDGAIVSAPVNQSAINGGATQISGNFTSSSAHDLANKLKYGALPLSFKAQDAQTVSATLGSSQLKAGMLAGGIGLILVVIYSLIYYRALGLVTIASLVVSGGLTYACLVMLATQIGFTLSLAGIAGFIVAIGITADSFVVFFERMKDEVHEGRSAKVAVPRAWVRARRTILSADTVSFLAAAILYYFAAGDVRGFAFTLGLSTILDLIVVFLFTHPLVSLLSRLPSFSSARLTGLSAVRGGPAVTEVAAAERRTAATERARARRGAAESRTSTVVLDKPEEPAVEVDEAAEPPAPDETAPPLRRTTPEPGTAAERAAARRARMREQKRNGEQR